MSEEQPQPKVTDTWTVELPKEMWDLIKDPALFVNACHVIGSRTGNGTTILRATFCENFGKAGPTVPRSAICMDVAGAMLMIEAFMKAVDSIDPGNAPPMEMLAALRAGTGGAPDMHGLAHKVADELIATSMHSGGKGLNIEEVVETIETYLNVAFVAGSKAVPKGSDLN